MLHGLMRNESLVENKERTRRLYTSAGLQVRTRRRKELSRACKRMLLLVLAAAREARFYSNWQADAECICRKL